MLGNAIKHTTTTTGMGNLTLVAVTGYPKMSDAFPVGFPLSYVLLDGAGLFLEAGIGYLSDATTLVRAKVCATFAGGVYNPSNPTPVNLSGTTTVEVTPHAATLESMLPTVDSVSAGVSRYVLSAARDTVLTSQGTTAMRLYYMPFLLRTAARISSLMVNVNAIASGAILRAGIYSCNENGYIGSLIASTGDLDGATSTGQKAGSISPRSLPPGWYFVAFASNVAISMSALTTGAAHMAGGSPFGFSSALANIDVRYENLATLELPASPSASTTAVPSAMHNIAVYLGVQ